MRFVRNTLRVRQLPAVADHTRRMNRFTIRAFILIFITFYSVGSFYASVCLHHSIYFIVTNVANLNVKGDILFMANTCQFCLRMQRKV